MAGTARRRIGAIVAGSALLLAGCAAKAGRPVAAKPVQPLPAYTSARLASDTTGPVWPYRDYRLRGAWRALGSDGSVALLVHPVLDKDRNRNELHLLDLDSGRVAPVRTQPVGADQVILGYAIGDGWVAWEETCEGDLDKDPRTVVWKLYATTYDRRTFAIGKTRRIDSAVMAGRSRPLFGFDGATLFVATVVRAASDENGYRGETEIAAYDLAGKAGRREVVRAPTPFTGFAVSEGRLVLTRRRQRGGDDDASRTEVFGQDGKREAVFDPPPTGIVSRSPSFREGSWVWSELMPGEGGTTNVYVRSADGSVTAVTHAGNQAGFAGDWVFAEASENTTASRRAKSYAPGSQVFGMRVGTHERFALVDGLIERGEWWHIMQPARYSSERLVLHRDGTTFEGDGVSVVRVFRLPRTQ